MSHSSIGRRSHVLAAGHPGLHLLFAAAIDEHAGIGRVGEHLLDHLVGRPHPDELARVGADSGSARHPQAAARRKSRCTARALRSTAKRSNDRGERRAHLLLGILHHRAVPQPAVADRQPQGEFAAARLVQQVAPHARAQDVQFRREQSALDAEQQPVVRIPRIVDAILVGDERRGTRRRVRSRGASRCCGATAATPR